MPVDWNARPARGRFLFGCIALFALGLLAIYLGYQGLSEGSINVFFKSGERLVAYANGPHAEHFAFEVWSRMAIGAFMSALGVLCLLLWVFGGATRRERMLFSAAAVRSRRVRISGWVASLVIGAFVFAYVYAATRV